MKDMNKIYKVKIWDIIFKYKGDIKKSNVVKNISKLWYYEKETSDFFKKRLKEWDVFIDVWANGGYFSLLASQKIGDSWHVIALEPVKDNYELLNENIELNKVNNIETIMKWLGNQNIITKINKSSDYIWQNSLFMDYDNWEREDIYIVKFDDLKNSLEEYKIFIKIDTEWYEFEVLKWMNWLIDSAKNLNIVIEFSPNFYRYIWKDYTNTFINYIYNKWFRTYNMKGEKINLKNHKEQKNILLCK